MSDQNAVIERLRVLFFERFHVEVPSPDTDLLETGMLDSLQLVELLLEIEQEFGLRISIDAIELDDLRSLARLARVLGAPESPARDPSWQPFAR
ncbi:MAG TPA: acyl carrier protein [Burkholderiales bacterium]|nr:acyl carrier protein [Burkholderiales bacterium]